MSACTDGNAWRDQSGPARLLDMVEGRSKQVFKTWLQAQIAGFRTGIVAVYRNPNRAAGKAELIKLISVIRHGVPEQLPELATFGRTHARRAADVLAYFDRPGTSNGPTEAINGRLEHLRGTALGFRPLTNYVARSLLEGGGFRPLLHPQSG